MNNYTITKAFPQGEYDEKYGQRWWASVEEADMSTAFNFMEKGADFFPGDKISYEKRLIKETGPKAKNPGTEYLFLKKVKKIGGNVQTTTTVTKSSEPAYHQVTNIGNDQIIDKLDEILAILKADNKVVEKIEAEVDSEEPISLDDIPF